MQSMARKNEWPLDKMCLQCEGAYVYGLFMEGTRWDIHTGLIQDAHLKELTPSMPVIFIKAIPIDKQDFKNVYECPVYKTRERGPTYVWTFKLRESSQMGNSWSLSTTKCMTPLVDV